VSQGRRHQRAWVLLELVLTLALVGVIVFVLGKLVLDGIYLQRIAGEYANRLAVTAALTERLRADALGAVAYTWTENTAGPMLMLSTYADGSHRQVLWVFRSDDVRRIAEGRDVGGFSAERLQFSARIEPGEKSDRLVLELIVPPPARAWRKSPHLSTVYVLLPREALAAANTRQEPRR
jgi:type II secretory pathway pseudopilin PulG